MDRSDTTEREFRVDYFRHASVHWYGRGKVVHLPSGLVEEFDIAWNDRSGIANAKDRILKRLSRAESAE